jgi:hypothetical protein
MCCVPTGIISEDELDSYKKSYVSNILKVLNERLSEKGEKEVTEDDIVFGEEEAESDE